MKDPSDIVEMCISPRTAMQHKMEAAKEFLEMKREMLEMERLIVREGPVVKVAVIVEGISGDFQYHMNLLKAAGFIRNIEVLASR